LTRIRARPILSSAGEKDEMPARRHSHFAALYRIFAAMALLAPLLRSAHAQVQPSGTIPFVDKSFGYQLDLPGGWRYDRTAFFGPGGSLGLLRGAGGGGQESLQIILFRNVKPATMKEWLDFFSTQLGGVSGVTGVFAKYQDEVSDGSKRPYGYVLVRSRDGADRLETLYYCTRFDESTIWILSRAAVVAADAPTPTANTGFEIPAAFQSLVNSLRVTYDPKIAAETRAALDRGKEWLAKFQLQEAIRKLRIDENTRHYEIALAGKPIGYMTRRFSREWHSMDESATRTARSKKEGLRVRETSWRFGDDGSAFYSVIDLFSSIDGDTDLFESTDTSIPPASTKDAKPVITRDQCVRENGVLFSSVRTSLEEGMPEPRQPIRLEPTYLGLSWARLLPALLGRDEQPAIGFTIYDSETRALLIHTIRAAGESVLPGGGKAWLYEARDGMSESASRILTDNRGHLLRLESGDLLIRLADESAIESTFAARRADALKRVPKNP
jgi:hypothetical protein